MCAPLCQDRGAFGKIALHGYLYRKPMAVLAASGGDDHATLTLGYDFDGTDAGYPFLLRVNVTYSLHAADLVHGRPTRFGVTTSVRNTMAARPRPYFNSWHSYFKVADISRTSLELDGCSRWNHIRVPHGQSPAQAPAQAQTLPQAPALTLTLTLTLTLPQP